MSDEFEEEAILLVQLVEKRAYGRFERRGHVHGYDQEDWYTAQAEVTAAKQDLKEEIERLFSEAGFHLSQVAEEQVEGEIIAMLERCSNLSPEERAAVFAEGQKRIGSVLRNNKTKRHSGALTAQ